MIDFMTYIIALFITIPILSFFIIFFVMLKLTQQKSKAVRRAADMTTILLLIAVATALRITFGTFILPWLIIFLILMFGTILYFQWKTQEEVLFLKAFKSFWRVSFLLFTCVYFVTVFYGILIRIIA
ncbi:fatty acid desaturase [Salirhabdus euzebyi]|uniref:Fatty acid desaturase n=1 Tax=Salirhabdus euzebyi TaxID=394506 RepID=A0A841Q8R1_9BACI|nr:DUF3397 domain-containing protein [Salirhabdus euzebyi]MBB6455019.1 fatty acid desaturase [Salirhabdus euzebyi]